MIAPGNSRFRAWHIRYPRLSLSCLCLYLCMCLCLCLSVLVLIVRLRLCYSMPALVLAPVTTTASVRTRNCTHQ